MEEISTFKKYYSNPEWRERHLTKMKEKVICECGKMVARANITVHKKSKTHITIVENQRKILEEEMKIARGKEEEMKIVRGKEEEIDKHEDMLLAMQIIQMVNDEDYKGCDWETKFWNRFEEKYGKELRTSLENKYKKI